MGLQKCALNLDRDRRELQPHGTEDFPCAGFREQLDRAADSRIPWHWHGEFELIFIREGNLEVRLPEQVITLQAGQLLFINANVLHYAAAAATCLLHSLVFSPLLISGSGDSVFAKKFIQPLASFAPLGAFLFSPYNENGRACIAAFTAAFEALEAESPGHEFVVRENLSRLCLALYQIHAPDLAQKQNGGGMDTVRIKKMLDYIHARYAENLTLAAIAGAADIGQRECLRCFRRLIRISPLRYVQQYRLARGAQMLLDDREKTVAHIAALCGFDSPGNFSQLFRRIYTCTPKDYRKKI